MRSNRVHLRAPVNDEILYLCDGYVLKCLCSNISEGGVLLSQVGRVPSSSSKISILLPLIQYPEFSKLSQGRVIGIERSAFDIEIIRAKIDIARSFDGKSDVEKILMKHIGASFSNLAEKDLFLVQSFVTTFSKNMVFLLTQFQNMGSKTTNIPYVRKLATLLGYDGNLKMPLLRQQVIHDYQSIESL